MTMTIKEKDFIEIDYTGKLIDGTVFDTTLEEVAKKNSIHNDKTKYNPLVVCVGEQQVVRGLDKALVGKEIGKNFTIKVTADQAFGKKDIKMIKLVPMSVFRKQNIMPQPGLQLNIDGQIVTILRANGGRILVDFNHPLAGKEISYEVKINKTITDPSEKIKSYLRVSFPISQEVSVHENKAIVYIPGDLPKELTEPISKKLKDFV